MFKNSLMLAAAAVALVLFAAPRLVRADDGQIELKLGGRYLSVGGDEGRFREDNYQRDRFTGGLEYLRWTDQGDGESASLELRVMSQNDYRVNLDIQHDGVGYLRLDVRNTRKYYDGSNEAWDPTVYGLDGDEVVVDGITGAVIDDGFYSAGDFVDRPDDGLWNERLDLNLEIGLTPEDAPDLVLGWHRWQRKGDEVLLRGERARVTNPNDADITTGAFINRQRSIPSLSHLDGTSDLFYVELSDTAADKYNWRLRGEYEQYDDDQFIEFPRYKWDQTTGAGGAVLDQYRTFSDEPDIKNWDVQVMVDAQQTETSYWAASYMYDRVQNQTSRDVIRPNKTGDGYYNLVGNDVDVERRSNVGTLAYRKDSMCDVEDLTLVAGLRVEDANTDADGSYIKNVTTTPITRTQDTSLDETWIEENLRLIYRGIENTTASLDVELEQRDLDWAEFEDVNSQEFETEEDPSQNFSATQTSGTPGFLDYATDIKHRNQKYTLTLARRIASGVKLTGVYRYSDLERDYSIVRDNNPAFFPGLLGDYSRKGQDASLMLQCRTLGLGTATVKYQYIQEDIETDGAGGADTQDWERQRLSASLSGTPTDSVFLVASFILEDYELDTPTNITDPNSDWGAGSAPYDYSGDVYTLLLDATVALADNVNGRLGYQQTSSKGDNAYRYNQATAGIDLSLDENQTVTVAYSYYGFEDRAGNGADDYAANGVYLSYSRSF